MQILIQILSCSMLGVREHLLNFQGSFKLDTAHMEHMGEIYFLYGYMLLLKKQQQNKTKQRNQQKNLLSCITFIYRIQMRSQKQLPVTTCKNKCQV